MKLLAKIQALEIRSHHLQQVSRGSAHQLGRSATCRLPAGGCGAPPAGALGALPGRPLPPGPARLARAEGAAEGRSPAGVPAPAVDLDGARQDQEHQGAGPLPAGSVAVHLLDTSTFLTCDCLPAPASRPVLITFAIAGVFLPPGLLSCLCLLVLLVFLGLLGMCAGLQRTLCPCSLICANCLCSSSHLSVLTPICPSSHLSVCLHTRLSIVVNSALV